MEAYYPNFSSHGLDKDNICLFVYPWNEKRCLFLLDFVFL